MTPEALGAKLAPFIRNRISPSAELLGLQPTDGHAGLTYFTTIACQDWPEPERNFVLRMAPPGVKRRGNTDVFRQVPLLKALREKGLPVPQIPYADPGEDVVGAPFLMMERLPGEPFFVWDPDPAYGDDPEKIAGLWRQAVAMLPRIHQVPLTGPLAGWEAPRELAEDLRYWRKLYTQSPVGEWTAAAERLEALLLGALPEKVPTGLFHGDYQPGNLLYKDWKLTGIIDWELSGNGPQLIDLGWLLMMVDRECWDSRFAPRHPISPAEVLAIYEEKSGKQVPDAAWYQAFAQFKLGAIACLNLKLHRTRRREDPVWELFANSVPRLYARAEAIVRREI